MKRDELFFIKWCDSCRMRHHFDIWNEYLCVHALVRFDERLRKEREKRNESLFMKVHSSNKLELAKVLGVL